MAAMTSGSLDYQLLIRLHNGRYIRRNYETMTMWFGPKRKLLLWKGRHKSTGKDMPSGKSVLALGKSEVSGDSERDWEIAGTQECTIQSLRETLFFWQNLQSPQGQEWNLNFQLPLWSQSLQTPVKKWKTLPWFHFAHFDVIIGLLCCCFPN